MMETCGSCQCTGMALAQFTMFWNDDNVKGITLWGYIEGQTRETNTGS